MTSDNNTNPKNNALEKLQEALSMEEINLLADAVFRAYSRSLERRCLQDVGVKFDDKGRVTHILCSDDIYNRVGPGRGYHPE